jgi:hypothetical protein
VGEKKLWSLRKLYEIITPWHPPTKRYALKNYYVPTSMVINTFPPARAPFLNFQKNMARLLPGVLLIRSM